MLSKTALLALAAAVGASAVTLKAGDPHVFLNGRWDESPGTWWASSGFKLHASNLKNMTLNLGPHTTQPNAAVGLSVNYGPFQNLNVSEGEIEIPLNIPTTSGNGISGTVVRLNVQGWQNNRINVESIVLNDGARPLQYTPSRLAFQFIGDSLSAGQFLSNGVDGAWPFLTGETLKAEHNINAQPGAALTDIPSFGNVHGVSFQFFRTEDTGFFYTEDHNFTTPWNFKRDVTPTHIVIHIGANDAAQNVTGDAFVKTYINFTDRLRGLYPHQPILVFTPWGWPNADGTIGQYYPGRYQEIVEKRHAMGDRNVFLVNTTGWVTFADVFPDNQHPNPEGHQKISNLFLQWLRNFGVRPLEQWATPA